MAVHFVLPDDRSRFFVDAMERAIGVGDVDEAVLNGGRGERVFAEGAGPGGRQECRPSIRRRQECRSYVDAF